MCGLIGQPNEDILLFGLAVGHGDLHPLQRLLDFPHVPCKLVNDEFTYVLLKEIDDQHSLSEGHYRVIKRQRNTLGGQLQAVLESPECRDTALEVIFLMILKRTYVLHLAGFSFVTRSMSYNISEGSMTSSSQVVQLMELKLLHEGDGA